jgi:hypothetical protein
MSFCPQCGARLAPDVKFCTACGAPVTGGPPANVQASVAPSGLGKGRALLVGGLVAAGLVIAGALIAIGPETPKPAPPANASAPDNAPPPAAPTATKPATGAKAITASRWERYVNTRYGVGIDYPADLFSAEPPPPDNAGRGFNASAAKARFSIYSHANALEASRDELQAEDVLELGDAKAEKLSGDTWYVVIATTDREVILRRVLLSEENTFVHRLEIVYPKASANAFKPIVARMMQSFSVDPAIPEKAAEATERASEPPQATPQIAERQASGWQTIETIRLGIRAAGVRKPAGVALEIPRDWTRTALPETYQVEFAAPARSADARLRILIQTMRVSGKASLAREAEAIKSTIQPGVNDFKAFNEADVEVALRTARRLTLTFQSLDETYPQQNEYLIIRAGETVFTILVQGPTAKADAIQRVFAHVMATLGVAE